MPTKSRTNLLNVASGTRIVDVGLRLLGHSAATVVVPPTKSSECVSRPSFGTVMFTALPKRGGKENLKTLKNPISNTSPIKSTCARTNKSTHRAAFSPRFSAGFQEHFLTSTFFFQGCEGLMNIDLSLEELRDAVRLFVFGKTGVNVKGKTVDFQIDLVTDQVSGASVHIGRPSSDLPPLGRHTA